MSFRFSASTIVTSIFLIFYSIYAEDLSDHELLAHPEVTVSAKTSPLTEPNARSLAQKMNTVAGGTNLILNNEIREARATSIQDTLGFQTGVLARSRFGAEESRLSIRGSGIQRVTQGRGIKLTQDGAPLDSTEGSYDFQSLEPLAVDAIEIYRGGNALEIGSSALGGAINYRSKTGYTSTPFQMRLEAGSFGYKRGQISSGAVVGDQDYYLSLSHYSEEGYRDHTTQNANRIIGNWGYQISPNAENRIHLSLVESQSEIASPLLKSETEINPQQGGSTTVQNNNRRDFQQLRLTDRFVYDEEGEHFESTFFYLYRDLDQPIFQVIDKVSNDFGIALRFEKKTEWISLSHRFFGGINLNGGFTQDHRFENFRGNRGKPLADAQLQTFNQESYLFDEVQWGSSFYTTAGIQGATAFRGYEDHWKIDGNDSSQQNYRSISPRFGLRYEITKTTQIFGNYSRGFEPPSFQELTSSISGPSRIQILQAQTADTLEFGTRGEQNDYRWESVFYHSWIEHELLTTTISPTLTRTRNADSTIHQGIEQSLERTLHGETLSPSLEDFQVNLKGVYLWSHFYFDHDPLFNDNQIAGIPEHLFQAECRFEYRREYYLAPRLEWTIDKYPVDHQNTLFADPSALFSVRAGYRSPHGYHIFIEGKNLLDTHAISTTSVTDNATLNANRQALFYPANGIAFYGGIEYQW